MQFEFVTTKMATLESMTTVEKRCQELTEAGWQLHSWSHKPDGGLTVLMVLPPSQQTKAPTPDGIPLRSQHMGQTKPNAPLPAPAPDASRKP